MIHSNVHHREGLVLLCQGSSKHTRTAWLKNKREKASQESPLSLSALCPRTVCDVSLSRVCGGKQKEVGSTGPAGACQLLGCLLLIKENRNRSLSWHKMWNLIFFAVPSSSSVCTDRDSDVSSDRSLIFPLSVATDLRLMDPSSETMWGSCGRKEKTTFFFFRIQLGMRKQNGKGGVGGDAVCLVTGQRPWFVQMTSSFYYPWYPAVVSAAAHFSLTQSQRVSSTARNDLAVVSDKVPDFIHRHTLLHL